MSKSGDFQLLLVLKIRVRLLTRYSNDAIELSVSFQACQLEVFVEVIDQSQPPKESNKSIYISFFSYLFIS